LAWLSLFWSALLGGLGAAALALLSLFVSKGRDLDQRRSLRWVLMLAGAVLGVIAGQLLHPLRPPPQSTSRVDAALDSALAAVLDHEDAQAKLSAPTRSVALLMLRARLARGVEYLSPRDLELWADYRLRVARSSTPACARMWQGGDNPFALQTLESFSDDDLQNWAELSARGVALSLEGKPAPPFPGNVLPRGFAVIGSQLPSPAREAFQTDSARANLSEARACQMFQTLFGGAAQLEPQLRTDVYRALAHQLAETH
jgi:hypothetical protein